MEFVKNICDFLTQSIKDNYMMLIQSALILVIGWWLINKICKISLAFFQKSVSDAGMSSFLYSLMKFSLRLVLIIIIMAHMGLDVTSLMAAIAASLVAIGISLKDNISNLVSGIILVINKPIHVGDYIEFDGVKGEIIKIEMLFTTLKSDEKEKMVVVPNSKLISNNIIRKSEYNVCSIKSCYTAPLNISKSKEVTLFLNKEILLNKKIDQIPEPVIKLKEENDGVLLEMEVFTKNKFRKQVEKDVDETVNKLSNKMKTYFLKTTN